MSEDTFSERFSEILDLQPIATSDKALIKRRYVRLVMDAETKYFRVAVAYHLLNNVIACAGVALAALVSLQDNQRISETGSQIIFWFMFALSIMIPLSTKVLDTFSINKKYILDQAYADKLVSEGWSFLGQVGQYNTADVESRVRMFADRVEKLTLKRANTAPATPAADAASELLSAGPNKSRVAEYGSTSENIARSSYPIIARDHQGNAGSSNESADDNDGTHLLPGDNITGHNQDDVLIEM